MNQAPNFYTFSFNCIVFLNLLFLSSFLWFNSVCIFYLNHISSKAIIHLYFLKGHHLFSWGLYIFCFTQSTLNLYTIVLIQEPTIIDIFFSSFFGHHTSFYNLPTGRLPSEMVFRGIIPLHKLSLRKQAPCWPAWGTGVVPSRLPPLDSIWVVVLLSISLSVRIFKSLVN